MNNAIIIAGIIAAESSFIIWAAWDNTPYRLRGFIAIQMILIALFGPKLFLFFGHSTNVTGAFYAAALMALAIIFRNSGRQAAISSIHLIIYALSVSYVMTWLLALVQTTKPENLPISTAIDIVVRYQPPIILASAFVTIVAIAIMVLLLNSFQRWWGTVLAIVAAQIADSLVFYPLAFSNFSIPVISEIMLTGLMFKLLCTVGLVPAYWTARARRQWNHPSQIEINGETMQWKT